MPVRKMCNHPCCTRYAVEGTRYCVEHQSDGARDREWYKNAKTFKEQYNSNAWRKLRREKLTTNPYCEVCGEAATEVHHIVAPRGNEELLLDKDNLMSLCRSCHEKITKREHKELNRVGGLKKNE